MLSSSRRKHILTFTIVMYTLTAMSILTSYNSSKTFLQMTLKLSHGVNVLILAVFTILNLALLWQFLTWLLFGELRLIEQEHIFERVPFTVLSIIIMTSMFSDYQLFNVLTLSVCLVVLDIFHWILKDRLEQVLQSINTNTTLRDLFFSKYIRNFVIFAAVDYCVVYNIWTKYFFKSGDDDNNLQTISIGYGIGEFQTKVKMNYNSGDSVFLLFGMEFCVLFIDLMNLGCHTLLNFYEFYCNDRLEQNDIGFDNFEDEGLEELQSNGLEGKFIYEKIIDICSRVAKTMLHFLLLFRLQLIVLKDIVWDIMSLYQGTTSLWKTYKNNKQLDDKLPNIKIHDLMDHDNICIVCMDDLVSIPANKTVKIEEAVTDSDEKILITQGDIDDIKKFKRPKKLPCGHMLHLSCLKNWMERSQTCPICRLPVFDENGNVKPSVMQTRPRETNSHISTTNSNVNIHSTLYSHPTPTVPIEAGTDIKNTNDDNKHLESWYTFHIDKHTTDETNKEIIQFSADTLPHLTSLLNTQLKLSLDISRKGTEKNNNTIVIPELQILHESHESTTNP